MRVLRRRMAQPFLVLPVSHFVSSFSPAVFLLRLVDGLRRLEGDDRAIPILIPQEY